MLCLGMRPQDYLHAALPRRSSPHAATARRAAPQREARRIPKSALVWSATIALSEFRRVGKADGQTGSRPRTVQPFVFVEEPSPPRINTSAILSFFIKSLIRNDLKSNRISKCARKSPRINTYSTCSCKSPRINTSKNHRGEGEGSRRQMR